jgi:phosphonoacetaldehyde hydrolase
MLGEVDWTYVAERFRKMGWGLRLSQENQRCAQYHGRLQAVILDWAGTTVDFGSLAPVRTLQKVFARANLSLTESEARQDMGRPKKDHIGRILAMDRIRVEWKRVHGRIPGEAEVDELYQQFVPLQFSCLLEYSTFIPGAIEAIDRFRGRGLKIGTTTGYTREILDLLVEAGRKAGFVVDCNLCPGDVGAGRPHPFMIYESAVRLQVYPLEAIVKVGDTAADIQEGLNAGVWSVGVAATGNMVGLSQMEFEALSASEQEARLVSARAELEKAGAHYVVDKVSDVAGALDDIEARLQSAGRYSGPFKKKSEVVSQ